MRPGKLIVLLTFIAAAAGFAVVRQVQRYDDAANQPASLSTDLAAYMAAHSRVPARVIVNGTEKQLRDLASRHGLPILRVLEGQGVLAANSAQLDLLSREPGIGQLSGDLPVGDHDGIDGIDRG